MIERSYAIEQLISVKRYDFSLFLKYLGATYFQPPVPCVLHTVKKTLAR